MAADEGLDWIVDLHEEHGARLTKLAVMLGAGESAQSIVHDALVGVYRRRERVVDPIERVETLQERVVHFARALGNPLALPDPENAYTPLTETINDMPRHLGEILVVSHYLSTFGPELASVMRMTVRGGNQRLEVALETLRHRVGSGDHLEAFSQEASKAIKSSAKLIKVRSDEKLEEELRAALSTPRRGRVRGQLVVVASIVALALGAGGAAVTRESPELPQPQVPSEAPLLTPSPTAPVAMRAVVQQVPIYYVGRGDGRLYREHRDLPTTDSLARSGIEALMTLAPLDPDYVSLWEGQVVDVALDGDMLTVDLDSGSYDTIQPEQVAEAINQMVYTASQLMGNDDLRVRFLSNGQEPPEPFSEEQGYGRSGLDPMPNLWISEPGNQAQHAQGLLTVTGMVRPGLGEPEITVTDSETGESVASASAQTTLTTDSAGWQLWEVAISLPPGSYEVAAEVTIDGASSGENKVVNIVE